jgi:hypothetical protein
MRLHPLKQNSNTIHVCDGNGYGARISGESGHLVEAFWQSFLPVFPFLNQRSGSSKNEQKRRAGDHFFKTRIIDTCKKTRCRERPSRIRGSDPGFKVKNIGCHEVNLPSSVYAKVERNIYSNGVSLNDC